MIRDCLIVGIRDEAMSEHLQMESELTLDKAKKLIRQREAVQQQQSILKGSNETLETINARSKAKSRTQRRLVPLNQQVTRQPVQKAKLCRRCGKSSHPVSHVQLKMQHTFAVTERATMVLNVYHKRLQKLLIHSKS